MDLLDWFRRRKQKITEDRGARTQGQVANRNKKACGKRTEITSDDRTILDEMDIEHPVAMHACMDFCPNCGTRLAPLKKKEGWNVALLFSCLKCGYEKRATRPMTTVTKIMERSPIEHIAVIGKAEQKLRTLPTVRIGCPRCGNTLA
jgi:DNA-directed RNA polymerase subunit M